jgi:hypothetical protein
MEGELRLFSKPCWSQIILDPPAIQPHDSYPPPPNHSFEAGIGDSKGDPELMREFALGDNRVPLQFLEKIQLPYFLGRLK